MNTKLYRRLREELFGNIARAASSFNQRLLEQLRWELLARKKKKPKPISALEAYRRGHARLRPLVFVRDRGVCAKCGLDCVALWEAIANVKRRCDKDSNPAWPISFQEFRSALGKIAEPWPNELWNLDLVEPFSQGGLLDLANARTLCVICHRLETNSKIYGKDYSAKPNS